MKQALEMVEAANRQPMTPWAIGAAVLTFLGTSQGMRVFDALRPKTGERLAAIEQSIAAIDARQRAALTIIDRDLQSIATALWKRGTTTNRLDMGGMPP